MAKEKFGIAVAAEIAREVDELVAECDDLGATRSEIVEAILTAFIQTESNHAEQVRKVIIRKRKGYRTRQCPFVGSVLQNMFKHNQKLRTRYYNQWTIELPFYITLYLTNNNRDWEVCPLVSCSSPSRSNRARTRALTAL